MYMKWMLRAGRADPKDDSNMSGRISVSLGKKNKNASFV